MTDNTPIAKAISTELDSEDEMARRIDLSKLSDAERDEALYPLDPPSGTKPSAHYFAKALEDGNGRGFMAQYGIPGLVPGRLRDESGAVALFETEEEAELAAARRMIDMLNIRGERLGKTRSSIKYESISPNQFAKALADIGMSPTFFAYLVGSRLNRVLGWLTGPNEKDDNRIPHVMALVLALFSVNKQNVDIAERYTETMSTERKPKRLED